MDGWMDGWVEGRVWRKHYCLDLDWRDGVRWKGGIAIIERLEVGGRGNAKRGRAMQGQKGGERVGRWKGGRLGAAVCSVLPIVLVKRESRS